MARSSSGSRRTRLAQLRVAAAGDLGHPRRAADEVPHPPAAARQRRRHAIGGAHDLVEVRPLAVEQRDAAARLLERRVGAAQDRVEVLAARDQPDPQLVDEHARPVAHGHVPDLEQVGQAHRLRRALARGPSAACRRLGAQRAGARRARVALHEVLGDQALGLDAAARVGAERGEPAVDLELDPRLVVRRERDVLDRAHPRARDLHELPGIRPRALSKTTSTRYVGGALAPALRASARPRPPPPRRIRAPRTEAPHGRWSCRRSHRAASSTHGFEPSARGLLRGARAARGQPGPVAAAVETPGIESVANAGAIAHVVAVGVVVAADRRRRRAAEPGHQVGRVGAQGPEDRQHPAGHAGGVAQARHGRPRERRETRRAVRRRSGSTGAQVAHQRAALRQRRPRLGQQPRQRHRVAHRLDRRRSARPSAAAGACAAPRGRAPAFGQRLALGRHGPQRRRGVRHALLHVGVAGSPARRTPWPRCPAGAAARPRRAPARGQLRGLGERRVEVAEARRWPARAVAGDSALADVAAGPGRPCASPGRGR